VLALKASTTAPLIRPRGPGGFKLAARSALLPASDAAQARTALLS